VAQDGLLPVEYHAEDRPTVFYVTRDGGASWNPTTALKSPVNDYMVWSWPDMSHGFVTDGNTLYTTQDGGQTWQETTPNVGLKGTSQLDFVSDQVG